MKSGRLSTIKGRNRRTFSFYSKEITELGCYTKQKNKGGQRNELGRVLAVVPICDKKIVYFEMGDGESRRLFYCQVCRKAAGGRFSVRILFISGGSVDINYGRIYFRGNTDNHVLVLYSDFISGSRKKGAYFFYDILCAVSYTHLRAHETF